MSAPRFHPGEEATFQKAHRFAMEVISASEMNAFEFGVMAGALLAVSQQYCEEEVLARIELKGDSMTKSEERSLRSKPEALNAAFYTRSMEVTRAGLRAAGARANEHEAKQD